VRWSEINDEKLPAVLEGDNGRYALAELLEFLRAEKDTCLSNIATFGSVLLRGFQITSIGEFAAVVRTLSSTTLLYSGGDARRTRVSEFVYTANNASGARFISPHNELGYSVAFPDLVFFFCKVAASEGGETPLTDGRKVLQRIGREVACSFRSASVTYIQNLPQFKDKGVESAKTWRDTFETDSRDAVNAILDSRGARYWWNPNGTLHCEETVPAVVTNGWTSEAALFCQADRWHASQITDEARNEILNIPGGSRYHHCRFGNGAEIPEQYLTEIGALKQGLAVLFPWQAGNILCIDNRMVLHGRMPFRGHRDVYVAMGRY
jgi:alpha-ketoglutarate-dependent taurine dioxygenase